MMSNLASTGVTGPASGAPHYHLDDRQKTADNSLFLLFRGKVI